VLRKCPEMLDSFLEKAPRLLDDRSHSVLLAGATLMLDICAQEPAAAGYYRSHVPVLCRILRSLIMAGFAPGGCPGGGGGCVCKVCVCWWLVVAARWLIGWQGPCLVLVVLEQTHCTCEC
jgi:hypothetical protein